MGSGSQWVVPWVPVSDWASVLVWVPVSVVAWDWVLDATWAWVWEKVYS